MTTQQRVRVHPVVEVMSTAQGRLESMRTISPPVGKGLEYLPTVEAELAELPQLLAEKVEAPSVEPGVYDLVIDPSNLWLTIHESIGHATELDRALGYEAAYAGTSFATPDQIGVLRYGSEIMNVTGDGHDRLRRRRCGDVVVPVDHGGGAHRVPAGPEDLPVDGL